MTELVELGVGRIHRGHRVLKFDRGELAERWTREESKATERGGSFDRAPRTGEGEVGIVEEFETHRADFFHLGLVREGSGHFGGSISLIDDRAVGKVLVFLTIIADLRDILHDPFGARQSEEILLPFLEVLQPFGMAGFEFAFDLVDFGFDVANLRVVGIRIGRVGSFSRRVQIGKHTEVLVVGQRVVFMSVALGALSRDSQNAFADGVHAIEEAFDSELLGLGSTFFVGHGVAEVSGGDFVILACVGEKVAGDLVDDELIVFHVAIEGLDNPVAVGVHLTREVFLVSG